METLRQEIEEKRRLLDQSIQGREDLLKHSQLSRELDYLIERYMVIIHRM
ncbi:MAG: hypothetical protein HFH58_06655 [Lachnospiraceae bacterium]|nr:hypothetical protein [Lachnospiraceae bacterium]MCI9099527.1 hypothetical protein [Lachnospiraceae bacterium]